MPFPTGLLIIILLIFTYESTVLCTELPENRLKCTDQYVLLTDDLKTYRNDFKTFSIEISGKEHGMISKIVTEKCKSYVTIIKPNRAKRALLDDVFAEIEDFTKSDSVADYVYAMFGDYVMGQRFEMWESFGFETGRKKSFENNPNKINEGLNRLLALEELTASFLDYHRIHDHIKLDLDRTNKTTFLETISIENLRCEKFQTTTAIHFDLKIPRFEKLKKVKTCDDVGYTSKQNYYYRVLEKPTFQNETGVFKVNTTLCIQEKKIIICPNSAISTTFCSMYNSKNCPVMNLSLKSGIFRSLSVGYIVFGSAKHVLKTEASGWSFLTDVKPNNLLYLNPGKGEILEYEGKKLEWQHGNYTIENL